MSNRIVKNRAIRGLQCVGACRRLLSIVSNISAGAINRNTTIGTTASAPSGKSNGIAGTREIRNILTNTAASLQSVRATLVGTAAGVQANRINLIGTIATPRFGDSNAAARGRAHRIDAMAASRLGRRADALSGHLGQVRVRFELGQARSLGGTILGRRAIALKNHMGKVRVRHEHGPARGPGGIIARLGLKLPPRLDSAGAGDAEGEAPPRQRSGGSEGRRGINIDVIPNPFHDNLAGIGVLQARNLNPDTIALTHLVTAAGMQQRANLPLGFSRAKK